MASFIKLQVLHGTAQPCAWTFAEAGVDSAWEQKKLEARKMPAVGAAKSLAFKTVAARFVRRRFLTSLLNYPQNTFIAILPHAP